MCLKYRQEVVQSMNKSATTIVLLLFITVCLSGCSVQQNLKSDSTRHNTRSSSSTLSSAVADSAVSKDSNAANYTLDWLGKKFSKMQEDAKYNNDAILNGPDGEFVYYTPGYTVSDNDLCYHYIPYDSSPEDGPEIAVNNGVIVAYGSLNNDDTESVYNFIKDTPFENISPIKSTAFCDSYEDLTWKSLNGYLTVCAISIGQDFKGWHVYSYCYHSVNSAKANSDNQVNNNDNNDSSDEEQFKTIDEDKIAALNCKITKEQGLKIVNSKEKPVDGFPAVYEDTREIKGKYYYLYTYETYTDKAYCVNVYTGALYKCSEDMKLTAVN